MQPMRYRLLLQACTLLAGAYPATGRAHPHEFVDTSLAFRFDDGTHLNAIAVHWLWDDLTSLLILADLGMDPDADGILTPAEKAELADRMQDWPADYDGDLHLRILGRPVPLGPPTDVVADLEDGRLSVSYLRALPEVTLPDGAAVTLQAYDPSYYAFYDLADTPAVLGRANCQVSLDKPDLSAAQRLYDQFLGQLSEEELMEQGRYPDVGGAFADRIDLTCAAQP